jgi:hypothetical protein
MVLYKIKYPGKDSMIWKILFSYTLFDKDKRNQGLFNRV